MNPSMNFTKVSAGVTPRNIKKTLIETQYQRKGLKGKPWFPFKGRVLKGKYSRHKGVNV